MSKKRKRHGYAERLKYMHMLENGFSRDYIEHRFGINKKLLGYLWARYCSEGPSGLLKKQNVKADYAFKLALLRDIEENHLTLVEASLKYNASASQINVRLLIMLNRPTFGGTSNCAGLRCIYISGTCPLAKASLSRRQPSITRFARLIPLPRAARCKSPLGCLLIAHEVWRLKPFPLRSKVIRLQFAMPLLI